MKAAIEYLNEHGITEETINDACNFFASSYEEYNAMWELLAELLPEKD